MDSIIDNDRACLICGNPNNLHRHHIFGGRNRQNAEEDGLWVYLCARHHTGDDGVHRDRGLDRQLKELGRQAYESKYSRQAFVGRYF